MDYEEKEMSRSPIILLIAVADTNNGGLILPT